ncbi:MAG TPA: hypothetical protein VHV76_10000 [Mycobacteriales bacterium]|nr:hypothetical protein [Mycobacteriales bacterium]
MNPDLDQLNETFAAHESLAPDADAVLARSHEIARNLKRRQWAVRATGGAVLGAGLIVGGVAIPRALHHSDNAAVIETANDAGGAPTTPSSPSTLAVTTDDAYTAFFDAGYTYADAQQLAQVWHESGPDAVSNAKAEAGAKLLKGLTLPVSPSGTPATPQDLAMQAFFNAGYDYNDAVALGQKWHETDIGQIKVEAGQKLENGETLPVAPSGGSDATATTTDTKDAAAAQAFFDAGYTYDDAVQLAQTWNLKETFQAKVEGGQKLEQGKPLPISPSGTPASADVRAMDAYFAAGYDYSDAKQLAQAWHESDLGQVKVEAGQKLENGETLPVAP